MQFDLEALKAILADQRTHLALASIVRLSVAEDRSHLKCLVKVFPEQREMVARMTWEATGPDSGMIFFPVPEDLVMIALPDGDEEQCCVIRRLTSKVDKIPMNALNGDFVIKANAGKRGWLTALNLFLTKGDAEPTENLVLGQQLKNLLGDILVILQDQAQKIANHQHVGNLGYPTGQNMQGSDFVAIASEFDDLKSSPVDDELILSDVAFTEKGE